MHMYVSLYMCPCLFTFKLSAKSVGASAVQRQFYRELHVYDKDMCAYVTYIRRGSKGLDNKCWLINEKEKGEERRARGPLNRVGSSSAGWVRLACLNEKRGYTETAESWSRQGWVMWKGLRLEGTSEPWRPGWCGALSDEKLKGLLN